LSGLKVNSQLKKTAEHKQSRKSDDHWLRKFIFVLQVVLFVRHNGCSDPLQTQTENKL